MQMKLDDLDLIKRVEKDGVLTEIRSIHNLSVSGRRSIVELRIPGADSNVFQDFGREPLTITFDGELVGVGIKETLDELRAKFDEKQPIKFVSDIAPIGDVEYVVIEDFRVHFVGGGASVNWYSMVLREYKAGGTAGASSKEAPSQDESARKAVQDRAKEIIHESTRS